MILVDVVEIAATMRRLHPDLREGQALMNALNLCHPGVYEAITGTDADCFYDDSRIPIFYNYCKEQQ